MSAKDFGFWLRDFWNDFKRERSGLVGLAILILSVLVVAFEPLLLPWGEVNTKWRSIDYWQDNSASAPPAWTNAFRREKLAVTTRLLAGKPEELELDGGEKTVRYDFSYKFNADKPPLDVIVHGLATGDVPVAVTMERPDGQVLELAQRFEQGLQDSDLRISLDNEGRESAFGFVSQFESEDALASITPDAIRSTDIIFNEGRAGMATEFKALKGEYKLSVTAMLLDPAQFKYEKPYVAVSGAVSGVLGTDNMKRDIFSGLVAGLKWALLIGLLTSIVTVMAGVLLGVTAAYMGGATDWLLSRLYELIFLMPVLPFLIVVSAIFKPTIWTLILIICLFFWAGPFKPVYSMALQIKEETFVEASRA